MRGRHEAVTVAGVGGGELSGGVEGVECAVKRRRSERQRKRREVWVRWSGVRMVGMVVIGSDRGTLCASNAATYAQMCPLPLEDLKMEMVEILI